MALCVLLIVGTIVWQEWLYPHLYEARRKRRYFAAHRAQLDAELGSAVHEQPPTA